LTKKEFLNICSKYNLKVEEDFYISAYLPGLSKVENVNDDSLVDFELDTDNEDNSTIQMYAGLEITYDYKDSTTTVNYTDAPVLDTSDPIEFEKAISSVMLRYNAIRKAMKEELAEHKLLSVQEDFNE
jgi:hypothetical protein